MQEVLEFILKNITTVPADVVVTNSEENGVTTYSITVNPDDVGRIIGKEGKVIKAIRTIIRVMAIQQNLRVRVSVISDDDKPTTNTDTQADEVVVTVEETPEIIPTPESVAPVEDSLSLEV